MTGRSHTFFPHDVLFPFKSESVVVNPFQPVVTHSRPFLVCSLFLAGICIMLSKFIRRWRGVWLLFTHEMSLPYGPDCRRQTVPAGCYPFTPVSSRLHAPSLYNDRER
jgi:hypothetical protein